MVDKPEVSIIIPTFNCQNTILRCIESIQEQDYENIEIIIVDDGSTDDTVKICERLQRNKLLLIQKKNAGVSSARNVGLRAMRGDFFMFVDADDYLPQHSVTTLMRGTLSGADLVIGSTAQITGSKKTRLEALTIGSSVTYTGDKLERFRRWVIEREGVFEGEIEPTFRVGSPWAKLFESSLKSTFFDENIKYSEDLVYINEQLKIIDKVSIIKPIVYNYVEIKNSLSHSVFVPGIVQSDYALSNYLLSVINDFDQQYKQYIFDKIILLIWHSLKTGIVSDNKLSFSSKRAHFLRLVQLPTYKSVLQNSMVHSSPRVSLISKLLQFKLYLLSRIVLRK